MKRHSLWTTRFMAMMFLVMSLCLVGCGEKDSSNPTNPTNPEIPDTPVVPGDSETIPTSGGTVTKGDMTISFPSGTFSSDTKVSVTEVAAGQTLGEDEISKFYKLVVPLNTQQSFKVSIKSSETADVALVAHAPSVSTHDVNQNTDYSDVILPSTYANGTYTAEIPQFDNNGETTNVEVTFGLARIPNNVTGTRAATRAVDDGDINWTLYWKDNKDNPNKQQIASDIDEAIKDAVTVIKALGFKVKNHRIVPIIITSKGLKEGEYGQHRQSFVSDNWNDILLNSSLLFGSNYSKKKLRCSVIHEMFHYFQSAYDPRGCFRKAKFGNVTVMRIMEAGGVWIEKFMDESNYFDGMWKPNIDCVMKSALDESVAMGPSEMSNAQSMGYGSSVILQWFTSNKGNKSILSLYETWRDKGVSNFEDWLKKCETATGCQFFNEYNDFVEKLALGKVIVGTETTDHTGEAKRKRYNVGDFLITGREEFTAESTITLSTEVLQWGIITNRIGLQKISKESIKGKQLTIKQGNYSVFTKAFIYDSNNNKATFLGDIYDDKPMVINDETTLRNMADYNNTVKLYLVSYQGANNHAKETSNIEVTLGEADNPMKIVQGLRFDLKWRNENVFTIGSHWTWAGEENNYFSSSIGWSGYDVLEFASSNDASGDVVLTGRQIKPSSTIAIQSNSSFTLEDQYKLPGDYTSDTSMEVIVAADLKNNKVVLKSGWLKYHYKANQNIGSGKTYGKTADELLEVELRFKDIVAEETITDWTKPNKWDWQHFTITDANLEKGTWTGTYFKVVKGQENYQRVDENITNGWNINIELVLHQK